MLHRFDAFRYNINAERCADVDDRGDELVLLGRGQDRNNQLAIDLQAARSELEQADDRSVTRAEIIDLDIDAEILDALDIGENRKVALVERDRFQQLERQSSGWYGELRQAFDQVFVMQPLVG